MTNEEREELIEETAELALYNEKTFYGWTQSILAALQEKLGLAEGNIDVFASGSAMAAGMGRRGEVCGALTAGVMAVGILIGRRKLEDRQAMGECMKVAREVTERFEEILGSMRCWGVQERVFGRSYDLNDMEDRQAFEEAGGHDTEGCPRVVYHGAKIAADVVLRLQGR